MPPDAVIDADPEKFGEMSARCLEVAAEEVVIVYVPAGSVMPLSVNPSVVSVIATSPETVAE